MKLADDVRHSYENVEARCPYCQAWNTYNWATDLRPKGPLQAEDVSCRQVGCGQPFRLIGNSNHPFEHLIWDAQRLLGQRYFMAAVLMAAQAFEVFAGFYARRTLLYEPLKLTPLDRRREVAPVAKELHEAIDEFAFKRMVNLMLNLVLLTPRPSSLADSAKIVGALKALALEPSDSVVTSYPKAEVAALLLGVKRTRIGKLRNRTAHKNAYRPTEAEASEAVKEAGDLLFPLSVHLGLFATFDAAGPGH